jgi:3-deoxy-7-phosphoheptulonate synthase
MPVGFKNGTGGSIQIALDAIGASSKPHHFLSVTKQGVSAIVTTTGNDACHLILRGGKSGQNYTRDEIDPVSSKLREIGLPEQLMVDCSHGNSNKDYRNQPKVAADLCEQMANGATDIAAVMIESNIVEGNQKISDDMVYGQSVTDACINWQTTEEVLQTFAEAVEARRAKND